MDYYKTLGIPKTAAQDEIKKAYRKLAHQYHPDKNKGDDKKFKEVNEAYQVLGDEKKRAHYDRFGTAGSPFGGDGGGFNPFGFGGQNPFGQGQGGGFNFNGQEFDLGDIFGDIFGGGFKEQTGPFGFARGRRKARGNDISVILEISLEDAAFGAVKTLELNKFDFCAACAGVGAEKGSGLKTCGKCGGAGKVEQNINIFFGAIKNIIVCPDCAGAGKIPEKQCEECRGTGAAKKTDKIVVEIPAGISDSEMIKIIGAGEAPAKNLGAKGAKGDLYVAIKIKPHKIFRREGANLHCEIDAPFSLFVLGGKIEIPALSETGGKQRKIEHKIPAGFNP
ncbi:MAG: DnaJ domain-containing protein, partial [Patescibacteria group bacterium]